MTTPKDAPREVFIVLDRTGFACDVDQRIDGAEIAANARLQVAASVAPYRVVRYVLADEEGKE